MQENQNENGNGLFIMVGSVLPEDLKKELKLRCKEITLRLPENSGQIQILDLEKDEMSLVVSNRKEIQKHKEVISSVSDLQKRNLLLETAIRFKKELPKNVNYSYKTNLKGSTNLSWSQFNVLIESLVLNGFASIPEDDKDMIIFSISEEEIIKNGIRRIEKLMEETSNELDIISTTSNFDKDTLKKVNLLKKKLKFQNDNR